MDSLTLSQDCGVCGGRHLVRRNESRISRISTDSRTLQPGDLFVALRGENFDGHQFVEQAAGTRRSRARLSNTSGTGTLQGIFRSFACTTRSRPINKSPRVIANPFRSKSSPSPAATAKPRQKILLPPRSVIVFVSRKRKATSTITSACRARFSKRHRRMKLASGKWA